MGRFVWPNAEAKQSLMAWKLQQQTTIKEHVPFPSSSAGCSSRWLWLRLRGCRGGGSSSGVSWGRFCAGIDAYFQINQPTPKNNKPILLCYYAHTREAALCAFFFSQRCSGCGLRDVNGGGGGVCGGGKTVAPWLLERERARRERVTKVVECGFFFFVVVSERGGWVEEGLALWLVVLPNFIILYIHFLHM